MDMAHRKQERANFNVALRLLLLGVMLACTPVDALWPKPEAVTQGKRILCVKRHLDWRSIGYSSDILSAAFSRYAAILRGTPLGIGDEDYVVSIAQAREEASNSHRKRCHVVRVVEVSVTSSDQSLTLETRESYSLSIAGGKDADGHGGRVLIQANSVYGALRAMESLAQLVHRRNVDELAGGVDGAGTEGFVPDEALWLPDVAGAASDLNDAEVAKRRRHATVLLVKEIDIYDAPRFRYRGLLIDTARHFLPISVIKDHLDAMAMTKMNCLHWHLTDHESFPWEMDELPELAAKGAFAAEAVYSSADIQEVVEYARYRGVRVIAEIDMPGHTQSWGRSHPELLTECFDTSSPSNASGRRGPLNPARNETFGFIWRLLREVSRQFPDPYVHLGGDESNPEVQEFMRLKDFGSDYGKLEGYFMEQAVRLAQSAGKAPIVWQEAFDSGASLPPYTRVQVWKWWKEGAQQRGAEGRIASTAPCGSHIQALGDNAGDVVSGARRRVLGEHTPATQAQYNPGVGCQAGGDEEGEAWKAKLKDITGRGYDAILSAPWYLNLGSYASEDWKRYYVVDPTDFDGATEQKDRVLGGTACAWGEYIDAVNAINRIWPRAAAVAERLWSPASATDMDDAAQRLADLRCRMLSRGIAAQSMGPGFCPGELTTRM